METAPSGSPSYRAAVPPRFKNITKLSKYLKSPKISQNLVRVALGYIFSDAVGHAMDDGHARHGGCGASQFVGC